MPAARRPATAASTRRRRLRHAGATLATLALAAACVLAGGCAAIVGKVTGGLAADLSNAILNSDDPAVIRDGAPAYLIMLDALGQDGSDPELLRASAALNSAYATVFVEDPARRRNFTAKALDLAARAACLDVAWLCEARALPFDEFERLTATLAASDVPAAYALATAWAGWIEARSDDWNAVADLGRVKPLMARLVALDEGYENGGPRLYMGVFETLLPPALGGRPEQGRAHFERVLAITDGRHLLAKVFYAESYARLVYDRELHDRLLREVLAADPRVDGLTLMNAIAQQQARALLASADDYF